MLPVVSLLFIGAFSLNTDLVHGQGVQKVALGESLHTSQVPDASPLTRKLSITIDGLPLKEALRLLGTNTAIKLTFGSDVSGIAKVVTVRANQQTVESILKSILAGTAVKYRVTETGQILLFVDSQMIERKQALGSVSGRVIDSATGDGIDGVSISIPGSAKALGVVTRNRGEFTIENVPEGDVNLSFKLLGYIPLTQKVHVAGGQTTRLNVVLKATATALSGIVTTATGQQRRVEVANDIVKIIPDEIAARSPVRSVADVLEASQVPGVQVQRSSGDPGAPTKIRIRGVSSISQSNDPVVMVDGMWIDGTTSKPSKLDDIDPATIASIEIVRGPSAATLYGQDASNGVIVITTKKGSPGVSRWDVSYNRDWGQTYGTLPLTYVGLGYSPQTRERRPCPVVEVIAYSCIQDAVSIFDPNNPLLGKDGTETNSKYLVQLDGGSNAVTYAISASTTNTIGVRRTAPVDMARFRRVGYVANDQFNHPSELNKNNITSSLYLTPKQKLAINLTAVFAQTRLKDNSYTTEWGILDGDMPFSTIVEQYSLDTLLDPNGQHRISSSEQPIRTTNNIIGGVLQYGPFNKRILNGIMLNGTLGAERGSTESSEYLSDTWCIAKSSCFDTLGRRSEMSTHREIYTARISSSSNINFGSFERFFGIRPSFGGDLRRSNTRTVLIDKKSIPPGDRSMSGGEVDYIAHSLYENTTAGWYINSTIAILRRIYFDVGVRQDIGSAITSLSNAKYPKIGGSWLVSDESFWKENNLINLFRVRSAFGHSAVQPDLGDIYGTYAAGRTVVNGILVRSVQMEGPGNKTLQPERAIETEFGFDADLLYDRLNIVATYAKSLSTNVLVSRPLPPSLSGGLYAPGISPTFRKENIARVQNHNVEIAVTARLIENRNTLVTLNYALTLAENRVNELGTRVNENLGYVEGYPLTGVWRRAVLGYRDDNDDGIISRNEVVLSDQNVYIGNAQPRYTAGYGVSATFFNQITLDSRFAYQSQYVQAFSVSGLSYGAQDTRSPLDKQAEEIVTGFGQQGAISDLRWNSASIQYQVSKKYLGMLKARAVSVSLQGRNLMLWSNYIGRDPGVNSSLLKSERRTDTGQSPAPRLYVLNFKVGL